MPWTPPPSMPSGTDCTGWTRISGMRKVSNGSGATTPSPGSAPRGQVEVRGEPPKSSGGPVTAGPGPGGPRCGAVRSGQSESPLPGLLPLSAGVTQTPLHVTVTQRSCEPNGSCVRHGTGRAGTLEFVGSRRGCGWIPGRSLPL